MRKFRVLILLCLWLIWGQAHAQTVTPEPPDDRRNHPLQVFVERATRTLYFVDMVTGEETTLATNGERFTMLGREVLFFDATSRRVMLASPDGTTREHPFMQLSGEASRIDWLITADRRRMVWTMTTGTPAGALLTETFVSDDDGVRPVFSDGPRLDGLRVLPVAFSTDGNTVYMDYQPDGIDSLTAFPQYAGLFALTLDSDATSDATTPEFLPGEPGDFTGAGFGAGYFLRLELTEDLGGFNVHVYNLITGFDRVIPALRLRNFTQAGDVLVSPNGRYAVYALAQITGFGSSNQSVRTVFVLVDLVTMTQRTLTDPITTFVRPRAWTEDNTAVIFTSPQTDGTWKVNLSDGRLQRIANLTYLGMLSGANEG